MAHRIKLSPLRSPALSGRLKVANLFFVYTWTLTSSIERTPLCSPEYVDWDRYSWQRTVEKKRRPPLLSLLLHRPRLPHFPYPTTVSISSPVFSPPRVLSSSYLSSRSGRETVLSTRIFPRVLPRRTERRNARETRNRKTFLPSSSSSSSSSSFAKYSDGR